MATPTDSLQDLSAISEAPSSNQSGQSSPSAVESVESSSPSAVESISPRGIDWDVEDDNISVISLGEVDVQPADISSGPSYSFSFKSFSFSNPSIPTALSRGSPSPIKHISPVSKLHRALQSRVLFFTGRRRSKSESAAGFLNPETYKVKEPSSANDKQRHKDHSTKIQPRRRSRKVCCASGGPVENKPLPPIPAALLGKPDKAEILQVEDIDSSSSSPPSDNNSKRSPTPPMIDYAASPQLDSDSFMSPLETHSELQPFEGASLIHVKPASVHAVIDKSKCKQVHSHSSSVSRHSLHSAPASRDARLSRHGDLSRSWHMSAQPSRYLESERVARSLRDVHLSQGPRLTRETHLSRGSRVSRLSQGSRVSRDIHPSQGLQCSRDADS